MNNLENRNEPFFQFRKHNFKILQKMYHEYPKAGELFTFLVENMNERTNSLIVSQLALSTVLDCSVKTTYRATKYLIDNQYIKIIKSGSTNIYCVNADIVWTRSAEGLEYARFNSAVYVVVNEQEEVVKQEIKKSYEKHVNTSEKVKKIQPNKDFETEPNQFFMEQAGEL
jgi:hypothetical protein